jgi:sirohydrochlorin cobaltochelatase
MTRIETLQQLLDQGFHRIGQIEILRADRLATPPSCTYLLCHEEDIEDVVNASGHPADFIVSSIPFEAREISTYADDGQYRFTKGQINLKRRWVMHLSDIAALHEAIENFYPSNFSLWLAQQRGTLEVQTLRDKLNRQTGMYRFARSISDAGAQKLVQRVCGPAHQCAKKILWQIDENIPLDDSEASRFNGIGSGLAEPHALPLLCREACNHFVAECRKESKKEFEAKAQA